jgi:hypothetical protein
MFARLPWIVPAALFLVGADGQGKDLCVPLVAEAAQLLGVPVSKPEVITSGNTTVCRVPATDRAALVVLTREQGNPAQRLMVNAMIAERGESTRNVFHKEPTLGANAFSLREPTSVLINFPGTAEALSVQLKRDAGVKPADIDRLRAFAKRVQALK